MTQRISFFIREEPYGFLSNFDRTPFKVDGVEYPTNEHYYQSQKANTPEVAEYIRSAPHARIAMVLGRDIERNKYLQKYMVDDWDEKKIPVMLKGLRAKFSTFPLRTWLLDTEDAILFENNPEDPFWSIGPDGNGASWLGRLLMQVRTESLRSIIDAAPAPSTINYYTPLYEASLRSLQEYSREREDAVKHLHGRRHRENEIIR